MGVKGRDAPRIITSLSALLALAACNSSEPAPSSFYDTSPKELAGKPGTLIRTERLVGAPMGASAYKILYRSTGLKGKPIAVSGVVVIPRRPPPPGGRKIVAWAHPTTGVVRACAPSLYRSVFKQIQGLEEMLRRGYIVTATDYPGLGTVGPHPYLIGVSAGRAVLDSVRAAQAIQAARASRDFIVWGHSQGGHAALWTGQIAERYAPELKLVGVAAAAPATDLGKLFELDRKEFAGRVLTAMTIWSWHRTFGYPTQGLVDPRSMSSYRTVAQTCSESLLDKLEALRAEKGLEKQFLLKDPTKIEPWRGQMIRNTPGRMPLPAPVFIAQGTVDKIVRPAVTKAYAKGLCRQGTAVRLVLLPAVNHRFIADDAAQTAVAWMAARFAGSPAPTTCDLAPR